MKKSVEALKKTAEKALGKVKVGLEFSRADKQMTQSLGKYNKQLEKTKKNIDSLQKKQQSLGKLFHKPIPVPVQPKEDKASRSQVEQSIIGLKKWASGILGVIGIGFSLGQVNQLMEEFDGYNDQINKATKDLGDQAEIQQKILESANNAKVAYGDMAKVVSSLIQNDSSLFGSVEEATEFAEITTKLFKTAGKSDAEISSLQEAINKSFAKGIVDSETLNQLYERAPEAIRLISDSLGVSKEKLAEMAANGTMSLSDLKNAFLQNADAINAEFDTLNFGVSDALTNIRNNWGLFLDGLNKSFSITQTVGKIMVRAFDGILSVLKKIQGWLERAAKALGGFKNLCKLSAIVAGAFLAVFNAPKVLSFLKDMGKSLGKINLKMLAIIAVVILLALLIDDFLAFMRGDKSVIGGLFESMGIDADKARETIENVWNGVKTFLSETWKWIQNIAKDVFGELSEWWSENGEGVKRAFSDIWDGIVTLCTVLWDSLSEAAHAIFDALKAFWDTWGDTIMMVFENIWDTLVALIQPFLDALAALISFLASVFTGDWEGAWQAIKDFASAIWDGIAAVFTGAWDTICVVWHKAVEIFTSIFNNIREAISNKVTEIKNSIVEGFQAAIDWITSLPDKALQWGKDIIDGIVNGIKNAIGGIAKAAEDVANTISSFLHFSVPDEGPLTTYEQWMPDFMGGLAEGIQKNIPRVRSALEGLTGDLSITAGSAVASPRTAAYAMSGSAASRSVTQHVEINNTFNGERAGQLQSAKAMDKATGDITGELARAMAYTR